MRSCRLRRTMGTAAAISLFATAALAETEADDKKTCADMAVKGQREQARGRLIEARLSYTRCADVSCPDIIRTDCSAWLRDVEDELPSLVVSVRGHRGGRALATLSLDGVRVQDGRALSVNPGEHRVEAVAPDGRRTSRTVHVNPGERERPLSLELPPLRPAPRAPRRSAAWAPWALVGVSAGAIVSFALFGSKGRAEARDLRTGCAPGCDPEDVAHARRELIIADASLGASVLAAAGAALLWLREPSSTQAKRAARVGWSADGQRIIGTLHFR